jgi:hypothetical protein
MVARMLATDEPTARASLAELRSRTEVPAAAG